MRSFIAPLLLATLSVASPVVQLPFNSLPDEVQTQRFDTPFSTFSEQDIALLKQHVEDNDEPRLLRVATSGKEENHWSTEGEKALLRMRGVRFIDITDHQDMWEGETTEVTKYIYPEQLSFNSMALQPLFANISTSRMKATLTEFSGFRTRYYRSQDGKRSQQWLLGQVKAIAQRATATKIKVSEFDHPWGQNSIIAHVAKRSSSSVKKEDEEVVIISAHQDSTNLLPFLSAPGADDDGSGTTTILEAFGALVAHDYVPANHSLEFHWYSAEEGGLLGSQAVAKAYKARGQKVRAMIQLDMTAYVKPGTPERIGVIQDFVDPDLTAFVERLVDEYTDLPFVRTRCGYACSDHSSWSKVGAPSAFAIESSFEDSNHAIHSTSDTIKQPGFSFEHMAQFSRLSLGFAFELAGRA